MGLMEDQIDALNTLSESEVVINQIKEKIIKSSPTPKEAERLVDVLITVCVRVGRVQILHENSLSDGQSNKKKEE